MTGPSTLNDLTPALDQIIAPNAKVEVLGEHFGLTEGPVWVPEGGRDISYSVIARPT